MPATVSAAVQELEEILRATPSRLAAITDPAAAQSRSPGKWSRKQILGHLIDSASNNHQRFVRAALAGELIFPPYEQDGWVGVQAWADAPWERLRRLWEEYNHHLLHLMRKVPAGVHGALCIVEENTPVTLEYLMRDYVRHLKHHLNQILEKC